MSQYFPKPCKSFIGDIKFKVDFSNYLTKADIENITHVDTSGFALKTNLANLKAEFDKIDIDKLKTVPVDLSKLSNVVKNDVIKKTEYNKLVNKVNNIHTSRFIFKTKYNADKLKLENKIPDTSNLIKTTDCNTKITEIENKIPDISNLATKTALTTVENKIPDISNLATKAALTTTENKISNISNLATKAALTTIKNKIPDISNLTSKAALTSVENKTPNTSSLSKKSDYNTKITEVENNIKKLQAYDLSYYRGKKYFDKENGEQKYLVLLPMRKHFKLSLVAGVIDCVLSWQSKGISNESIIPPTTSNYSLNPKLSYYGTETRIQFIGSCLRQPKFTFTHKKIVNIYIFYELRASSFHINDPTLKDRLFDAVTLTKNADIDKYRYSGYEIGFDRRGSFSFPGGGFG